MGPLVRAIRDPAHHLPRCGSAPQRSVAPLKALRAERTRETGLVGRFSQSEGVHGSHWPPTITASLDVQILSDWLKRATSQATAFATFRQSISPLRGPTRRRAAPPGLARLSHRIIARPRDFARRFVEHTPPWRQETREAVVLFRAARAAKNWSRWA